MSTPVWSEVAHVVSVDARAGKPCRLTVKVSFWNGATDDYTTVVLPVAPTEWPSFVNDLRDGRVPRLRVTVVREEPEKA